MGNITGVNASADADEVESKIMGARSRSNPQFAQAPRMKNAPEYKKMVVPLLYKGDLCAVDKDFRNALRAYERVLELAVAHKNEWDEMGICGRIGIMHIELLELDTAVHYFQRSTDIAKKNNWTSEVVVGLCNIGQVAIRRSDFALALDLTVEALQLCRNEALKSSTTTTVFNAETAIVFKAHGCALWGLGRHDEAVSAFASAFSFAKRGDLQPPDLKGYAHKLESALCDVGRRNEAVDVSNEIVDILLRDAHSRLGGDLSSMSDELYHNAVFNMVCGDEEKAKQYETYVSFCEGRKDEYPAEYADALCKFAEFLWFFDDDKLRSLETFARGRDALVGLGKLDDARAADERYAKAKRFDAQSKSLGVKKQE